MASAFRSCRALETINGLDWMLDKDRVIKALDENPVPAPETPAPRPMVFTWPVQGEILRSHSLETLSPDPTMGDWRTHAGLDVGCNLGARVLCMTRGTVSEVREDEWLGTCVRVDHGGGLESVYANLSPAPTVKVGDPLEIGAILGAVGSTAAAESGMGPHLHLEVFRDGESVDPMEFLPE
jgi:murein DD-endopeptidase MepM/ murein hydrolase activator NlpD